MTLRERIGDLIARHGPLPVSAYMETCLHDPDGGYYATRPALGDDGDFITAPMVSQIFGEVLGAWSVEVWTRMGRPDRFRLVEPGPGLGVMMSDVLRVARASPGFLAACEVWLVETSRPLRARQTETLKTAVEPRWVAELGDVPTDAPVIMLANEFLDCLPIRQAVRTRLGWRERLVGIEASGALAFTEGASEVARPTPNAAPIGAVFEWSEALESVGQAIGALMLETGGAALFIDYGRDGVGFGDTLQALRAHRKECALSGPGEADLTAHVDFPAFLQAARQAGAHTPPVVRQGEFLLSLGAGARAEMLARARPDRAAMIGRQLERLVGPDQMGELFKVAAVLAPGLTAPGFQPAPVESV